MAQGRHSVLTKVTNLSQNGVFAKFGSLAVLAK
jgi:hypothetical protein